MDTSSDRVSQAFLAGKMYGSTIRTVDSYEGTNSYTYYPVVVIGAGESGIAMGCRLKEKLGFDQFRIFERQSGIGGTWWINRYPGVACDVPAVFYSFSFCRNPKWTTFYPGGPEIVQYLHSVCEKYEIVDKIQLNAEVVECRWIESEDVWELRIQYLSPGVGDLSAQDRQQKIKKNGHGSVYVGQETVRAKVVVSGVGGLVNPKPWPESIPGKENFQGQIFHSARWRYDIDLKDKDVVVIGTGCSAAQFVPRLTKEYGAKSVTQLMRSPPWIAPRTTPPLGKEGWEKWGPFINTYVPGFNLFVRYLIATGAEYDWRLFGSDDYHKNERKKLEAKLLAHMKETSPQKYWEMLTPNYGVCCKRRIFDSTWLPSLHDPKITLTTNPLTSISEKTVTLGPGPTYPDPQNTTNTGPDQEVTLPADVIVLANGFETTKWLHPLDVSGCNGKKLQDVFDAQGGASMYMGTAADGFPNFFVLFGPNTVTGHTSVIMASENMVEQSLNFIEPILNGDVSRTEIKREAYLTWTRDTQSALKKTVWNTGGCVSWYKDEHGWNSTACPYSQIWFGLRCLFPMWSDWSITYTSKGLAKKRTKTTFRYLAFTAAVVGIYQLRKRGRTVGYILELLKGSIRMALMTGAVILQTAGSKV